MYYDGSQFDRCGGASWPPSLPGKLGVVYLQGTPAGAPPCNSIPFASSATSAPGYLEFAMLHELFHLQGLVSAAAPDFGLAGHTTVNPADLMYAGNQPWVPATLDATRRNYYNPAGLPAGVTNLATSPYLMTP